MTDVDTWIDWLVEVPNEHQWGWDDDENTLTSYAMALDYAQYLVDSRRYPCIRIIARPVAVVDNLVHFGEDVIVITVGEVED